MDGHFKTKPALQKPGRKRTPKPHGAGRNGVDLFQRAKKSVLDSKLF